jgi:hypothetical protein
MTSSDMQDTPAGRRAAGADGRDGLDQRHEPGDVVAVAAGQGERQRDVGAADTHSCSERGVRPLKTQQKISGCLASDDVTQHRLDIRSYIDTARKHRRNAMDILHDLMLGRPWPPPAQALSP